MRHGHGSWRVAGRRESQHRQTGAGQSVVVSSIECEPRRSAAVGSSCSRTIVQSRTSACIGVEAEGRRVFGFRQARSERLLCHFEHKAAPGRRPARSGTAEAHAADQCCAATQVRHSSTGKRLRVGQHARRQAGAGVPVVASTSVNMKQMTGRCRVPVKSPGSTRRGRKKEKKKKKKQKEKEGC